MTDETNINRWNSQTSFILVMVGAIIGLAGIWRFSYLMYENGGGSFLIPYILAIVIMAVPLLSLELTIGYRFKSSLPKIFYNIKSEFEIVAWAISFLIFLVLIIYSCIMSWDLIYIILSLFKGWGNNPSVFFTTTLLHSTSSPYGLTYLVVPIGIGLIAIWSFIYLISRKGINKGISIISKISLTLILILIIGLLAFALQLPGSRTGVMALFNPNWEFLLDYNIWFTAFGQLILSYGLAYGIGSSYSAYLPEKVKLVDSAWVVVLLSLIIEVLVSILVFAFLGYIALGQHMSITSLVSDGFSLIFVVLPNIFNVIGSWVYIVAPAFYLALFLGGLVSLFALIEPLSNAISEKFMWSKTKSVKNLVFIGLFASFLFSTGMGEYLLKIVDAFVNQFAIIFVVLLEIIVFGWIFDLEKLKNILNNNSSIKMGKSWIILIKFVLPIIFVVVWILGVYNLIITGDRQSLLIQSILASIIVLVPLALTIVPFKGDYSLDLDNPKGFNYFRDSDEGKSSKNYSYGDKYSINSENNGSFDNSNNLDSFRDSGEYENKRRSPSLRNRVSRRGMKSKNNESKDIEKTIDDFADEESNGSFSLPIFSWDKFKKSKNGKNVLNNVDLSSEKFDSVMDDDYDDYLDNYSDRSNYEYDSSNEGYDDYGLDDDYEGPTNKSLKKEHKFRSSKDLNDFNDLEELTYNESPKSLYPKKGNDLKSKKKSQSNSRYESKSENDSNLESKNDSNSKSKNKKSKSSKSKKEEKKEKVEEIEYEDFTDDFFDDGVFGDEGYESLLDDYVEPKPKRKNNKKQKGSKLKENKALNSNESNKNDNSDESNDRKSEEPYYDFEGKGVDSVFNLDD